jgi:hypothetical protein
MCSSVGIVDRAQRIDAIKEVTARLASDSLTDANIVLDAFGLEMIAENWNSSLYDDVAWVLQRTDDHVLGQLQAYVRGEQSVGDAQQEARLWTTRQARVFLSHLAKERSFVGEVADNLTKQGVSSFVAHRDIQPSREWIDEIRAALESCHACVAFLHPEFDGSDWTDQEVGYCMGRRVPLVPVKMGGGRDPYGLMGRYQAVVGTDDALVTATRIVEALIQNDQTQPAMVAGAVDRLLAADSPKKVRNWLERLERFRVIPASELSLLSERKDQVVSAGGEEVSRQVESLLDRHGFRPPVTATSYDGEEPF